MIHKLRNQTFAITSTKALQINETDKKLDKKVTVKDDMERLAKEKAEKALRLQIISEGETQLTCCLLGKKYSKIFMLATYFPAVCCFVVIYT